MSTAAETSRVCKKCGTERPLEQFVKDARKKNGRGGTCMDCRRAYHRTWQSQPKARSKRLKYQRANAEQHAESSRRYRRNRPDQVYASAKRWQQANPEKRKAQTALNNAVRDGRVIKRPCEVCGNKKADGHHDDYSKPLQVRWLCHKHHLELEHAMAEHAEKTNRVAKRRERKPAEQRLF